MEKVRKSRPRHPVQGCERPVEPDHFGQGQGEVLRDGHQGQGRGGEEAARDGGGHQAGRGGGAFAYSAPRRMVALRVVARRGTGRRRGHGVPLQGVDGLRLVDAGQASRCVGHIGGRQGGGERVRRLLCGRARGHDDEQDGVPASRDHGRDGSGLRPGGQSVRPREAAPVGLASEAKPREGRDIASPQGRDGRGRRLPPSVPRRDVHGAAPRGVLQPEVGGHRHPARSDPARPEQDPQVRQRAACDDSAPLEADAGLARDTGGKPRGAGDAIARAGI